ncbi:MAG: PfkB family carbohydrate kinase [Spirochaetes bacterium]|jgi:sugar/nucleoside kinase (ribokinase family)|nr:PfkB family carbohydrate kinase [Spirochaetota bacterium]
MKVAAFTVAAMDFFPQQNSYFAGGNALNQAVRFSQMGYECAFLGSLGTDEAGDRIENLMKSYYIDLTYLKRIKGKTACNKLTNDKHGERFGVDGAWDNGVYMEYKMDEEAWNYIKNFDIWSTHANGPFYDEALKRKLPKNFMVVDFLHYKDYQLLERSLNTIDIAYFGGTEDMEADLSRLANKYYTSNHQPIVVLTLGSKVSMAFHGDKIYRQEALPVEKVIDTTGCGDAFQAGFSAEYYSSKNITQALLNGATQGRDATQSYGGVAWNETGITRQNA